MHAETLAYLLHNLPDRAKNSAGRACRRIRNPRPSRRQVAIPAGVATLGLSRRSGAFGWDNEFDEHAINVPSFSIDVFPVTNAQFLKFVQAGGYHDATLLEARGLGMEARPAAGSPALLDPAIEFRAADPNTNWRYAGMFGTIPLPPSWPVYVSHAEASAFARWAGRKLPTEAQWHRAAYGAPNGTERAYPWGETPPERGARQFPSPALGSDRRRRASGGRERIWRARSARQWMGVDLEPFRAVRRDSSRFRFIRATRPIFSTANIS